MHALGYLAHARDDTRRTAVREREDVGHSTSDDIRCLCSRGGVVALKRLKYQQRVSMTGSDLSRPAPRLNDRYERGFLKRVVEYLVAVPTEVAPVDRHGRDAASWELELMFEPQALDQIRATHEHGIRFARSADVAGVARS